jgi:hypothetical protein
MTALARARRCDPALIEAARGGDEKAQVSLIAAAQPDVRAVPRAIAARPTSTMRFRKRCCCCTGASARCGP